MIVHSFLKILCIVLSSSYETNAIPLQTVSLLSASSKETFPGSVSLNLSIRISNETVSKSSNFTLFESPYGNAALRELTDGIAAKSIRQLCKSLQKTEDELRSLFLRDHKLRLDTYWHRRSNRPVRVFYVEDRPPHNMKTVHMNRRAQTVNEIEQSIAARAQTLDVFALHSRPNASKVIYLDFDGLNITGTAWNDRFPFIVAPPFDTDNQSSTFSASERTIILQVCCRQPVLSHAFQPISAPHSHAPGCLCPVRCGSGWPRTTPPSKST